MAITPPAIAPYCPRYPEMLAGRAVVEKRGVQKQVIFICLSVFCGEAVKHMLLRNNTWVASPAVYESSVRGHASESVNYHDALGVYPVYTQAKDADGLCQATAAEPLRRGESVGARPCEAVQVRALSDIVGRQVTGCQRPAAYKSFLDLRAAPMPRATPACWQPCLTTCATHPPAAQWQIVAAGAVCSRCGRCHGLLLQQGSGPHRGVLRAGRADIP